MDDCIFCKIIKGEIPSDKIYEDEKVMAFLDIAPVNKGHVLVVPKEHYRNLLETPDELVADLMKVGKKIAISLEKAVGAEGINFSMNNKEAAGQTVWHTHLHIIPRFEGDGKVMWSQNEYNERESEEVAEKIREVLS